MKQSLPSMGASSPSGLSPLHIALTPRASAPFVSVSLCVLVHVEASGQLGYCCFVDIQHG